MNSLSLSSPSVVRRSFGAILPLPSRALAPRPVGLRHFGAAIPVAPMVLAPCSSNSSQEKECPAPSEELKAAAMWANRVTALVRLLARD